MSMHSEHVNHPSFRANPTIRGLRDLAEECGAKVEITGGLHGPYRLDWGTGEIEDGLSYEAAAQSIRLMAQS